MSDLLRQLSDPSLAPFLAATVVGLGLLALELAFTLVGLDTTVGEPGDLPDPGGLDAADLGEAPPGHDPEPAGTGLLHLIGLSGLPLTVWLAFLSGTFAATVPATSVASRPLRLLPRETTSAISERSFGNRMGRVVVGTARRGSPAQVRFRDGHGNTHYAMAEPLHEEEIAAGAAVVILRTRDGALLLVRVE